MSDRVLAQWKAMPLMKQLGWTVVALAVLANAPRWIEASLVAGGVGIHPNIHAALEIVTALGLVAAFTMGAIVIVHSIASYRERSRLTTGLLLGFLVLAWLAIPAILAPYTVSLLVVQPMAAVITGEVVVPWTAWAWAIVGIVVAELMIAGATVALAGADVAPAVQRKADAPSAPAVRRPVEATPAPAPAPALVEAASAPVAMLAANTNGHGFTRADAERVLGVKRSRAAEIIKEAVEAGDVEQVAVGRYQVVRHG